MGFVMLGLVTWNEIGLGGAVLQMFSHGIIAGLLFGVVGRMVYDRTHTRQLDELAGFQLSRRLPFAAVVFVLASMASMGLPGFSGFVAEVSVLIGAWQAFPSLAIVAGVGIVVGVAYLLRAMGQGFFAEAVARGNLPGQPGASERGPSCPPSPDGESRGQADRNVRVPEDAPGPRDSLETISVPERAGAALLLVATLVIGLFPGLLLDYILPSAGALLGGLQRGGPP
jgi:NADH-quinone oxidoreductase subunit M